MIYEFSGRVRYSEVDENAKLTLKGLVNYFQDVSTFHSEHLGVGLDYLGKKHQAWILSSWQIVIDRLPMLCEEVTSQTWSYEIKGFYGRRNFALLDGAGNKTAWANSVWVLLDTQEQRPVRPSADMVEKYGTETRLDMDYAPRKIAIPEGGVREESFAIGKHFLDTNHHVNNGQYIAMAEEYLPAGFSVRQVRAEYKKQAKLHDIVMPVIYRQSGLICVSLCSEEGQPYAVIEFAS